MDAQEATSFIHEKFWRGSKLGLSRTRELLGKIGDPQEMLRFVHIAGTNGKGSTSALLSSVLRAAGLRVGLFTSPYISAFNERMQVNGEPISDTDLSKITGYCAPFALSMDDRPTEFELVTVIAMEFFKRRQCDIVILETGMGGRLDSTNVITSPLCSVITNIGLDHTRELGDTVEKITLEKAGIIKPGRPVVIYDLPSNLRSLIQSRCLELSSPLISADFSKIRSHSNSLDGQEFSYKHHEKLFLPLLGFHQLKNAAVSIECLDVLAHLGINIPEDSIHAGFNETRWPARFELLCREPYFILDGGHNPQCAEAVAENLSLYFPGKKAVILIGVLADKDYSSLARILAPFASSFVTITPQSPRALLSDDLALKLRPLGLPVASCGTIDEGIKKSIELAGSEGLVCAVGSLYSAGVIREFFSKYPVS